MESMILTPRLACMAALVPQNARLADIGTDHGKLPISLLLDGHIASAIGSDIRSGPLAHAERNAKEHNVSLSLRLAPGLEAVRAEECDTVTIAGMGGQTIAEILTAAPWTAQGNHLLLLQPMTMIAELRRWLYAHGYAVERETLCREDRRRYVVLSVRGGAPKREMPLTECAVSPALLEPCCVQRVLPITLSSSTCGRKRHWMAWNRAHRRTSVSCTSVRWCSASNLQGRN